MYRGRPAHFLSPRRRPGPIAPPHERVKLGTSLIMRDKSELLLAWVPAFAGMTTKVMGEIHVEFQYIHRHSGRRRVVAVELVPDCDLLAVEARRVRLHQLAACAQQVAAMILLGRVLQRT